MKPNFTRCATQLEDRKKAVGFDPRTVGNIFSSRAANQVFISCHNVPQTYQTAKQSFNGGAEDYVVRAARSKTHKREDRKATRDDFMWMVMGFSMAAPSYNAPGYAM